jgi:hypothetical protein
VPCATDLGVWFGEHQCYAAPCDAPAGAPAWQGHSDGSLSMCTSCDVAGNASTCNAQVLWVAPLEVDDPSAGDGQGAKVLVIGWGSTYGPIGAGCRRVRKAGYRVAQVHLRHLNPFPKDLGDILRRYDKVLVPEMNLGQLSTLLRAEYLVDAVGYNIVRGLPLKAAELAEAIGSLVADAEGITVDLTPAEEALQ